MRCLYFKKFVQSIWLIIAFWGIIVKPLLASELEVDQEAAANKQPTIEVVEIEGRKPVPVIDITEPSPAGVSHNMFREYNVGEAGVVFNNNLADHMGWEAEKSILTETPIHKNEHLDGHAARIILAEVTGYNISKLLGMTEIFGQGADFILANPNGIYCNGAGFINAHQVTLTTGKPQLDYAGVLRSLQVDRGTIEIHGKGLSGIPLKDYSYPASPIDILSRAVKISAELATYDAIHIYTGKNKLDYVSKQLTPQQVSEGNDKPYLAIDGALVGKIGARKITIIATEQGVGVNCPPMVADADNIEITADGNISLKDIQTVGDLLVTSQRGDIEQEATQSLVQRGCKLEAKQGKIDLSTQKFHINDSAQFSSKKLYLKPTTQLWVGKDKEQDVALHLVVEEKIKNKGEIYSPRLIVESLKKYKNVGKLVTQQDLSIQSQIIHNQGGINSVQGNICLTGHENIYNQGTISSTQALNLITQDTLKNVGKLIAKQAITLNSKTFQHQGVLAGEGAVIIVAKDQLTNQGTIYTGNELSLNTQGRLENTSKLLSRQNIIVHAKDMYHAGTLKAGRSMKINATGKLTNQADIKSNQGIELAVDCLENEGDLESKEGKISLTAQGEVINRKFVVGATQVTIKTDGKVNNYGQVISKKENLIITAKELTNTGELYGHKGQALRVQQDLENKKTINTQGHLSIEAIQVTNQGILSGREQLTIQADSLDNINEINSLQGDVYLFIKQQFTNQKNSKVISKQNLVLQPERNNNQEEGVAAKLEQVARTGKFTNEGVLKTEKKLIIQANELDNLQAITTTTGAIKLDIRQHFKNQQEAYLTSAKGIKITSVQVTNTGQIRAREAQFIEAGSLTNQGEIESQASQITLNIQEKLANKGYIHAPTQLTVIAGELTNEHKMVTGGVGNLTVRRDIDNLGEVKAKNSLHIQAQQLSNHGALASIVGSLHLKIPSQLTNKGSLESAQCLVIRTDILNNDVKGKITTDQQLRLKNKKLQQVTNLGEIKVHSLQHRGTPVVNNIGTIEVEEDLILNTESLYQGGTIKITRGNLTIVSEKGIQNERSALLSSAHKLTLQAKEGFVNQGDMVANAELVLQADSLQNDGKILGGSTTINCQKDIHNTSKLASKSDLQITTPSLLVNKGVVATYRNLYIHAATLDNTKEITAQTGEVKLILAQKLVNHKDASIGSGTGLTLQADKMTNQGHMVAGTSMEVDLKGKLKNKSVVKADQSLTIQANELNNSQEISTKTGDIKLHIAQNFTNQQETKTTSAKDLQLYADEVTNRGSIKAQGKLDFKINELINQGSLEGVRCQAEPFQNIQNEGKLEVASDLKLNSDQLHNVGFLASKTGNLDLTIHGTLTNEKVLYSKLDLTLQVDDQLINKGTIHADGGQHITAGSLDNSADMIAEQGKSTLKITHQLTNGGQIKSQEAQFIEAESLTNQGTIRSQVDQLDLQIKEKIENAAYMYTPTQLTVIAGELINKNKMITAGEGKLAISKRMKNVGEVKAQKNLTVEVPQLTNHGALVSVAGSLGLTALDQLNNSGSLGSAQQLTIHTGTLTNEVKGVIYSLDNLNLKVDDLTNHGEIGANSLASTPFKKIHNTGLLKIQTDVSLTSDILKNQGGMLLVEGGKLTLTIHGELFNQTKDKLKSLEELKKDEKPQSGSICSKGAQDITTGNLANQGYIQAHGPITLKTTQQADNNGLLHAGGQLKLESSTALENSGSITALGNAEIIAENKLVNTGKLRSNQDLYVISRAGTLENQGTMHATANTQLNAQGDITQAGTLSSKKKLTINTDNNLNNFGVIQPGTELYAQAKNITNTSAIESKTAVIRLDATQKLHNKQRIVSEIGVVSLKAQGLENQQGCMISSGAQLTLEVCQVTNQKEATLSSSKQLKLLNVSKLINAGNIQALKLEHTGTPVVSNVDTGKIELQDQLTLQSQSFTSSGELTVVRGDLCITSQTDLAISKGCIKAQQGNLHLTATTGSLRNTGGTLSSHKDMTLTARGEIENKQVITAENNLAIQAQDLTNSGEIIAKKGKVTIENNLTIQARDLTNSGQIIAKQGTVTIKNLTGKLYNTNKIQGTGELKIEIAQAACTNEGTLLTSGKLTLEANNFYNQHAGHVQGNEAFITTQQDLTNSHLIGCARNLTLQVGRQLKNASKARIFQVLGQLKLHAHSLHNEGEICFAPATPTGLPDTLKVTDMLYNQGTIKSSGSLRVESFKQLENKGFLVAEQSLALNAPVIRHLAGHIQSKKGDVHLIAKTLLHNASTLNASQGTLVITTDQLDNHTDIKLDKNLILNIRNLDNSRTISAKGTFQLKNLQTFINRRNGILAGGEGENQLEVASKLENEGRIFTKGSLSIEATEVDVINEGKLTANGSLMLAARSLFNGRRVQGGGTTTLIIAKKIINHHVIASVSDLEIRAKKVKQKRTSTKPFIQANQHQSGIFSQFLRFMNNEGNVNTSNRSLSSINDLEIKEEKHRSKHRSKYKSKKSGTPILQSNRNITLQVDALSGQTIRGGVGDTKLTIRGNFACRDSISSQGNLSINSLRFDNYRPIVATKNLEICATQITNHTGAYLQGGEGRSRLESKGDVYHYGQISSEEDLVIHAGRAINNQGTIQAANELGIVANSVVNNPQRLLFAKNGISIQTVRLTNQEGNIFTEGSIRIEGPKGDYADKISNITGDQEARIEAMGDITIRAKELENKGKVIRENTRDVSDSSDQSYCYNAQSDWIFVSSTYNKQRKGKYRYYVYDEYNSRNGHDSYPFTRTSRKLESDIHTQPAYINARGNLNLNITDQINNHDSKLIAGKLMQIGAEIYTSNVPENERITDGPYVINRTYSITKELSNAHVYKKTWEDKANVGLFWAGNQYTNCSRVYRKPETFMLYAAEGSTIRAGSALNVNAKSFQNGISVGSANVAPCVDPLEKVKESQTISTLSSLELPKGEHGLFTLQVNPHSSDSDSQTIVPPQVRVGEIKAPVFDAPSMPDMDTKLDIFLAEAFASQEPEFDDIRKVAEAARAHMSLDEEAIEGLPAYTPNAAENSKSSTTSSAMSARTQMDFTQQASTTTTRTRNVTLDEKTEDLPSYISNNNPHSHARYTSSTAQATDPGVPSYNSSPDADPFAEKVDTSTGTCYKNPPAQENIKNKFWPPLFQSRVKVNQNQYYGSKYFIEKMGLLQDGDGFLEPIRFLGDPFFESRLINDAIFKQTSRPFLYDDVATPEQQVKCLIDQTAAVTKDLKLSFGVALSKEQIKSLKKDILWYVEEEVLGQKVLVPQIYLTQTTIDNLRSGKGNGVYSRGDMNIKVTGAMTNTGNISSGGNQTIRAESLRNESFGNTQAAITSDGIIDLETKNNLENISGKIGGQQGTRLVSVDGAIRNETKLLNDSTLHMKASIESGADLIVQAKKDIVNKAGTIKALGDGTIKSETGDIKNETQQVVYTHRTHSSSHKDGLWNKTSTSHTTTETKTKHEVSSIDIRKNMSMEGRDITFMGTKVNVQGGANLKASRDVKALAVQDLEETSSHTQSSTKERGVFTSSSRSNSQSSYSKKATSKGPEFNIGTQFKIEAGGNADFEGAEVDAGSVKMDVQGKTTIRAAYDEKISQSSSSSDNKNEALFGLIKDNKGQSNSSKSYDKTAKGNVWKVRDKMEIIGKQDVVTEGIDVTAHTIHLESTQGNVLDRAAEEIHQHTQTDSKYKDKQGLLGLKWQGEQGRLGLKLKKKKENKSTIENNKVTGKSSSFKTISRTVTKEDGTKKEIAGNATFKAAKKVSLEATQIDIQGKLSLQGKEGVEVIAKKETEHKKEQHEHATQEISLGVKNSIIAAGYQAKAVKEAAQQLVKANAAHNSYRSQLRQAKKLLDQREITQEEYDEVAAEGKYHLAAISLATLELAAKTKHFLGTAVQAVTTAGSSLGFSVDLQGDINKTVEEFINYTEKAKGSDLKTQQLEVITEGTFKVNGSRIKSAESDIQARDVVVEAFRGAVTNTNSSTSQGGNITLDLAPSTTVPISGIGVSLRHEQTTGGSQGVQHNNSMMELGTTKLNVKKDVTIVGAQVKTSSLTGEVGGSVHIKTVVNNQKGSQNKTGANVGLNMGLTGGGLGSLGQSMGFSYGQSEESSNWVEQTSGLSSTGAMHLKVGGKTKLVGAHLGSDSGQMHLETEKVEHEDINGYKKSSGFDLSGGINVSQSKGTKAKLGAHGSAGYHRSYAKQKISSSLGQGTLIERRGHRTDIKRCTAKSPLNYLDTKSEMKLDSETVKLAVEVAVKPAEVGKEVIRDSKILYNTGKLVGEAVSKIGKSGIIGTVEAVRLGLAAGGAAIDMAKVENETQKLGKAETTEAFQTAANEEGAKLQAKMGMDNPAEVKIYQGDSEELKGKAASKHKASFNKKTNEINYNTARKDFNDVGTIAEDLAHESTHKAMSENKVTRQFINSKQEEETANIVGSHARRMADIIKDESKTQPTMDWKGWNAKNKGSDIFKENHGKLAKTKPQDLKASPGLLADRSPFYTNANNPLKEQQQLQEAQKSRLERVAVGVTPVEYDLPFVGPVLKGLDALEQGNIVQGGLSIGLGVVDAVPFPLVGAAVGKGLKAVIKGGSLFLKPGVQKGIMKGGKKLLGQPINQGIEQLDWIMNKHVIKQLPQYTNKSQFYISSQAELRTLIQNATHMPMKVQPGGRIVRIVDAGRTIGFDFLTGKPTNIYSVITHPNGNLITAFPGLPKS